MTLTKPTLVLDERRARRNIARMTDRARRLGVRFRPHFKTHQSRHIGRIFREFGVEAITVSSVDMAACFASDGWADILIAFPFNILEAGEIGRLASRCDLGLLVESPDGLAKLSRSLLRPVDIWVKVNVGSDRAGVNWNDRDLLTRTCREALRRPELRLRGLLTHNGRTYAARTLDALARVHADAMRKMRGARNVLAAAGFKGLEISVGDTPSCSRLDDFADAAEIRPGNFVLHDVMQLELGTCGEEAIAVAVACPVVSTHPARGEAVIYGGAIHLSKEDLPGVPTPRIRMGRDPSGDDRLVGLSGARHRQDHGLGAGEDQGRGCSVHPARPFLPDGQSFQGVRPPRRSADPDDPRFRCGGPFIGGIHVP
jgi:D-serine deaminase-like pyridoxal phosphate-dependent protein